MKDLTGKIITSLWYVAWATIGASIVFENGKKIVDTFKEKTTE